MRNVAEKLRDLEQQIAAEKGSFSLFALFLRQDSPDKWDVVASAPWLEKNKEAGLSYLADSVRSVLDPGELLSISKIVLVDQDDPALEPVRKALKAEHEVTEVRDCNFFGLEIKHGFIITSQRETENVIPGGG